MASKKGMVFIFHPSCPSCERLLPAFRKAAKDKGITFKKVDIRKCTLEECRKAELVPTILIDGKRLSQVEMERIIGA